MRAWDYKIGYWHVRRALKARALSHYHTRLLDMAFAALMLAWQVGSIIVGYARVRHHHAGVAGVRHHHAGMAGGQPHHAGMSCVRHYHPGMAGGQPHYAGMAGGQHHYGVCNIIMQVCTITMHVCNNT